MRLSGRSKAGPSDKELRRAASKPQTVRMVDQAMVQAQRLKSAPGKRAPRIAGKPARLGKLTRTRSSSLLWGLAMGAGAVAAAALARRNRQPAPFPDAAGLAAETAASVRNAAKGTVIAWVREADDADADLVKLAVKEAVQEALKAGADVTAVAIGAVEGAVDVAHLVDGSTSRVTSIAAQAAVDAATAHGDIAGARVYDLLKSHLHTQ